MKSGRSSAFLSGRLVLPFTLLLGLSLGCNGLSGNHYNSSDDDDDDDDSSGDDDTSGDNDDDDDDDDDDSGDDDDSSSDDDDSSGGDICGTHVNSWPEVLPKYLGYTGDGIQPGDLALNFSLTDQHGAAMCLSQLLGHVLVIHFSTRWNGPSNEYAAEAEALWMDMQGVAPAYLSTLMVQGFAGLPATTQDVAEWATTYNLGFPVLLADEQVRETWEVISFPFFLFIAPNGEVVQRLEARPTVDEILAFVDYAAEEWAEALAP